MAKKHKITWIALGKIIEVENGQSVLDAAIEHDIPLQHVCGGYCACTTCHIRVKNGSENISKMDEDEAERLADNVGESSGDSAVSRLACQTKVYGDISVDIP